MDSLSAKPPGKPKNTGVGSLSLLQWIFLTLHCRQVLYQLSYQGSSQRSHKTLSKGLTLLSLPFPCLAQVFIFSINIFPAAFIIWIQPDKEEPGMKVTRIFFLQQRSVGEVRKSSEFWTRASEASLPLLWSQVQAKKPAGGWGCGRHTGDRADEGILDYPGPCVHTSWPQLWASPGETSQA